jgi:hypothetical protein
MCNPRIHAGIGVIMRQSKSHSASATLALHPSWGVACKGPHEVYLINV